MELSLDPLAKELQEGRWTQEQHIRFLRGIIQNGKEWKMIEELVQTRQGSQVRSHAQKFFIKLNKISKDRKKGKSRQVFSPTQIQKGILDNFTEKDLTENTPYQIVHVITRDWTVPETIDTPKKKPRKKKHVTELKKLKTGHPSDHLQQSQIDDEKIGSEPQVEPQAESEDYQLGSESFFIQLLKLSKPRQHFKGGEELFNLFEFGHKDQVLVQQPQTSIKEAFQPGYMAIQGNSNEQQRKRSFCLPNEEEDPQKLKETLLNLHKSMGVE